MQVTQNIAQVEPREIATETGRVEAANGIVGTGEIVSLTSLRGLLALWIVGYHFWNELTVLFPQGLFFSPIVSRGQMAVPAFFMLSGFVLTYNYASRFEKLRRKEYVRFLFLRLARIYPVHLATLLAVAAMVCVSDRIGYKLTEGGYTARDFVLNVLLAQTWVADFKLNWNYPSWSISSEWFAYILFPFASAGVLGRLRTVSRATAFGIASLLGTLAVLLYWPPRPFFELVQVVPSFYVGASICLIFRGRPCGQLPAFRRFIPELSVLALAISCYSSSPNAVTAAIVCCFALIIGALVWLGPRCHRIWTERPVVFLGEISYSLYMTHTLAQKFLYRLLPTSRFEDADPATRCGVLAAYAVAIATLCLGSYYLVEYPSRRFFRKFAGGRAPSRVPAARPANS